MSRRITQKELSAQVETLNRILGREPGTIGAFELYGAYGGWAVHRRVNSGGGVTDLSGVAFTAREVHHFLNGMLAALREVGA